MGRYGGFKPCKYDAVDDGSAQIAVIPLRHGGRVKSTLSGYSEGPLTNVRIPGGGRAPELPSRPYRASRSRMGARQSDDDSPRRNGRGCRSRIRTQPRTLKSRRLASTISAGRAQDARV
jgi:hypothetical protein